MNLEQAQSEIRKSYLRGGPGTIISGLVWLAAALVASSDGVNKGFLVLFFGGMLIFPLATLVVKFIFKRQLLPKGHHGGQIVIETIFPMIGMLFAAWLFIPFKAEWVFPLASIAVGAHYFGFRSAYGDRLYWLLGALMCLVGLASILIRQPSADLVPYFIAGIEILFGMWFTFESVKKDK